MKGQAPELTIKTKNEATGTLVKLGAAWSMAKEGFSGRIKIPEDAVPGQEIPLFIFPNTPRAKTKPAPEQKPAA